MAEIGKETGKAIGKKVWAIAEGYIPVGDGFSDPALASHETACILNATDRDAHIELTIFFSNREPAHYALLRGGHGGDAPRRTPSRGNDHVIPAGMLSGCIRPTVEQPRLVQ